MKDNITHFASHSKKKHAPIIAMAHVFEFIGSWSQGVMI